MIRSGGLRRRAGRCRAVLAGTRGGRAVGRWWRRRTLHARVAWLVTGAVALGVVAVAGLAWAAVVEIQSQEVQSQLATDARAIAAQPDRWRAAASLPVAGDPDDAHQHPHDLGQRWQILGAGGAVTSASGGALPVTTAAARVAAGLQDAAQEPVTIDRDRYLMLTLPVTGGGAAQVAVDLEPSQHTMAVFAWLLVPGCVVGVGLAALLGRAVARAGLVPVQRLTASVEGVAASLDLGRPVQVEGVDEVARLGRSVNTLLRAIEAGRTAQRALVEDAGHELRTPLTSIRTNIELLMSLERRPELAHRLAPEERTKILADLDAQAGELATLTTELVELSREETTREEIGSVVLGEVVAAAVARVRIRAPGITFDVGLEPVCVRGRVGELERMVVNVLDNAAKWSPPGARVVTRLSADGPDRCVLTVTDEGPGIAAEDLPHVFDRFYRAAGARSMPGSGLGLAIVAQTVARHDGTVTAGRGAPGGTVLTITLPRGTGPE